MTAAHSLIGASSMSRWSKCPGSVRLSQGVDSKSSLYAEEGSDAHAYAAMCLTRKTRSTKAEDVGREFKFDGRQFTVTEEMREAVDVYVDLVGQLADCGTLTIEHKFDLSSVHPGCFGTADAVIYHAADKLLHVVDYKHGAGIPVEVTGNPQLQYYALGALLTCGYPAARVRMTIVQPRCAHPDGPVRSWEIDAMDLLDFRADLKGYAEATEDPNAPLVPGEHCRFCPARGLCPELKAKAQAAAKIEFAPSLPYDPQDLKKALDSREVVKAWLKAVDEFAYAEALAGRCAPGYKLVEKRANRKWRDEGAVVDHLQRLGAKQDVIYAPRTLKSPAQLEKAIDGLDAFWVKESSGHALVPESDKRPAAKVTAQQDFTAIN